jgi:hypothetical protein
MERPDFGDVLNTGKCFPFSDIKDLLRITGVQIPT